MSVQKRTCQIVMQASGGAQLTYVPRQGGCQNPSKVQQRRPTLAIMALVVAIAAVIERLDFPDMHCGSRLGTPGGYAWRAK